MTHDQKKQELLDKIHDLGSSLLMETMLMEYDKITLDNYENVSDIARELLKCSDELFNLWWEIDKTVK